MKKVELAFLKIGFISLFLCSMYPWFAWKVGVLLPLLFSIIITLPYVLRSTKISKKWRITLFLAFSLAIWESTRFNFFGIVVRVFSIFPIWVLMTFEDETKKEILDFILKWFSILLGVSLIAYILIKVGFPFPSTVISYSDTDGYDVFQNYYLCITKPLSFRFQSIFLEPGHMTMGIAPLLYIYRYNLNNIYVLLLFLAQLFSLSLAGYIVMVLGFVIQTLFDREKGKKFSFKPLILLTVILSLLVVYLPKITAEEDIFNIALLSRLDQYSETGFTRTSEDFDDLFDKVIKTSDKWIGIPLDTSDLGGAGIKKYIVEYGIIGFTIAILLYMSPYFVYRRRSIFLFCLIMIILLMQNTYPSWFCALISMITSTSVINNKNNKLVCRISKS